MRINLIARKSYRDFIRNGTPMTYANESFKKKYYLQMQKGGKFASINLTVNPKTVSRLRVAVDFPLKADFTAARIIVSRQKLPQNPRSTSCQAAAAATAAVFSYSFNAFRPIDI